MQAGTGTGKSLAYLVPAIHHAVEKDSTVVVSTATIALQRQLVDRDLPPLAKALEAAARAAPRRSPSSRAAATTCACNKLHGGDERPRGRALRPVRRSPRWVARSSGSTSGPTTPRPATATSSSRACPTARGGRCRSPRASASARPGAPSATSASPSAPARRPGGPTSSSPTTRCWPSTRWTGGAVLPEHDVVVVDEAHELVDRVTGVATGELSAGVVARGRAQAGQADRPVDRRSAGRGGRRPRPRARGPAARPLGGAPPARVRGAVGGARRGRAPAARGWVASAGRSPTPRPTARSPRPRWRRCSTPPPGCSRRSTSRIRRSATTSCGWPRWAPIGTRCCTPPRCGSAGCCASGCSGVPRWCSRRPRWPSAATSTRWPGSGGSARPQSRTDDPVPDPEAPKWSGLDVGSPFAHAKSGILYVAKSPAPARARRAAAGLPRRDRRARRGGGRPHARAVLVDAGRQAGHRGAARPAGHTAALPGRRRHDAAGQAVRRRRRDVAVRHAVALAGRRRARALALAA